MSGRCEDSEAGGDASGDTGRQLRTAGIAGQQGFHLYQDWLPPACGGSQGQSGQQSSGKLEALQQPGHVDNGIYFVQLQNKFAGSSIQFLNLRTNQSKPVINLEKTLGFLDQGGGLAVSPDGRWMLYTKTDKVGAELRLVENFH